MNTRFGERMGKLIDLTGQRFGKMTVVERVGSYSKSPLWYCKCDCGQEFMAISRNINQGDVKSCGCSRFRHGDAERHKDCRLYRIWQGIKRRCGNPAASNYQYYGARGITVCPEWRESYTAFRDWALANGYQEGLSIDRIDVNGNYCPENCRWITMAEQQRNKRNTKHK